MYQDAYGNWYNDDGSLLQVNPNPGPLPATKPQQRIVPNLPQSDLAVMVDWSQPAQVDEQGRTYQTSYTGTRMYLNTGNIPEPKNTFMHSYTWDVTTGTWKQHLNQGGILGAVEGVGAVAAGPIAGAILGAGGGAAAATSAGGAATAGGTTSAMTAADLAAAPGLGATGGDIVAGTSLSALSAPGLLDNPLFYAKVAGTGLDVTGRIMAGHAAKVAADMNAQRLEANAAVADQQAKDAIARGEEAVSTERAGIRTTLGTQRAGFAGQNVSIASGSPMNVAADTTLLGTEDIRRLRLNAARQAYGYTAQANDLRAQAAIARKTGSAQQTAGILGGVESGILGGTSLLALKYGWGAL